jgi:phosphate:Na+ symporter
VHSVNFRVFENKPFSWGCDSGRIVDTGIGLEEQEQQTSLFKIHSSLLILQLIGAVCLLLWGSRYVRQGFSRAFGASLRGAIHAGTKNRMLAFLSGLGVTALLQSSTATAFLLTSFARKKMIGLSASLAVILGADVSTTLVAQLLSFKMPALASVCLILGITGRKFYGEQSGRIKHICNIFIGLGFMMLSLSMIREISEPIKHSEVLPYILKPLQSDVLMALVFSAGLTWLLYSSLAAVLLFASLAANGIISLDLGLLLVLGANLGGALIPFAATYSEGAAARRITFGNTIMRLCVLVVTVPLLGAIGQDLSVLPGGTARHLVHFHMAFNIAVALIFLPITPLIAQLCTKIFPEDKKHESGVHPLYLDEKALESPVVALAAAARETLRIAEIVEGMLDKTIKALEKGDQSIISQVREADNRVDKIYGAIKTYMSRLSQQSLDPDEADRYMQILTFSTNLEHIGDIIEKSLMELAVKKDRKKENFSAEGLKEIKEFHDKVLENMKLAQAIFMSEDSKLAAQLVAKKQDIRMAADQTSEKHFKRLSDGVPQTLATSSLHLDIIRDYRRINSYATRLAYAILDKQAKPA